MFPLTSKMNDKFPLTQDINIGVSVHLAAAYPMLKKLLALVALYNGTLFAWCLAGTVLVFGLIYLAVFAVTSRSYYKIVGNQV